MTPDGSHKDRQKPHNNDDIIEDIRSAASLSELAEAVDAGSGNEAYLEAKDLWYEYHTDEEPPPEGLPGEYVIIDGHSFGVHGVTHSGTEAEGSLLCEHLRDYTEEGAVIYCEQGIRRMYFNDMDGVCEMDDYTWSMQQAEELDIQDTCGSESSGFQGVIGNIDSLRSRLRESVFSLIESGRSLYGADFAETLGDMASVFLTNHTSMSSGDDFESFRLTREVSENPGRLNELQAYYRKKLLPQPLEREWMYRHDPEIELFTHARNARMADYAVYHNEKAEEVHLIVGAAHQPGITYYLRQHRDGERSTEGFELLG